MKTQIYSLAILTIFIGSTTNTMQKPSALNFNGTLDPNGTLNPNGTVQSSLDFTSCTANSLVTSSFIPESSEQIKDLQAKEINQLLKQHTTIKTKADLLVNEIHSGHLHFFANKAKDATGHES